MLACASMTGSISGVTQVINTVTPGPLVIEGNQKPDYLPHYIASYDSLSLRLRRVVLTMSPEPDAVPLVDCQLGDLYVY